jgi:hypothetical protein
VPVTWHLATIMALVHAASDELRAGRVAERAVVETVLGAVRS